MKKILLALVALTGISSINAQTIKIYETLADTTILKYTIVNSDKRQYKVVFEETDPNYQDPSYEYSVSNSFEAPTYVDDRELFEETALKLMQCIKALDFKPMQNVIATIRSLKTEEFMTWGDSIVQSLNNIVTGASIDTITMSDEDYHTTRITEYLREEFLLSLAQFHGHFAAGKDNTLKLVDAEADDLQIKCLDPEGNNVTIALTTSGESKKLLAKYRYTNNHYEWNNAYDTLYYGLKEKRSYLGIPEDLRLCITSEEEVLLDINMHTDLSELGEMWDMSHQRASQKVSANVCGYEFVAEFATNKAEKGPYMGLRVNKGQDQLIQMGMELGGRLPIDYSSIDGNVDPDDLIESITSYKFTVNLLGWIQFEANMTDASSIMNSIRHLNVYETDEEFQFYLDRLNSLIKVNMTYFDAPTVRGGVRIDSYVEDIWFGENEWQTAPVIFFNQDNSSFQLKEYFTTENFSAVMEAVGTLMGDFKQLILGEEEEEEEEEEELGNKC